MSKIALGTAQFGFDYGINNERGKIPAREITEILNLAATSGIEMLDTAAAYGDSEERIGRFMTGSGKKFQVISKLPKAIPDPAVALVASLDRLQTDSLYGYLLHDFQTYVNSQGVWEALLKLRSQSKVKKIGFSLYHPAELERILAANLPVDLLQFPFNLFDRRFESYFKELKSRGVEIHVRSVFLQGLFFREIRALSPYFASVKDKLNRLREIARAEQIPLLHLCLGYALGNPLIDKVIVGVDSLANLEEILAAETAISKRNISLTDLDSLKEDDEAIILPFNWEKEKAGVR